MNFLLSTHCKSNFLCKFGDNSLLIQNTSCMSPIEKKWRTISIFVSSTFKDMEMERDYLNKIILPKLEEEFIKQRVSFQIIDLRWGVRTSELSNAEAREAAVLKVCLNEINRSRPFLITLLGNRYGWVPPVQQFEQIYSVLTVEEKQLLAQGRNVSVTELEILFGSLGGINQLSRSLFYFRDEKSYQNMTVSQLEQYTEQNPEYAMKLRHLKERIQNACIKDGYTDNINSYRLSWNGKQFEGLSAWGDSLTKKLIQEVSEELQSAGSHAQYNEYEQENLDIDVFSHFHIKSFVGRDVLLEKLKSFAIETDKYKLLIGDSGCGKSALMCALRQELLSVKSEKEIVVLFSSVGISSFSLQFSNILQYWCYQLSDILGIEHDSFSEVKEEVDINNSLSAVDFNSPALLLKKKFLELIRQVKERGRKIIILLDAADCCMKGSSIQHLTFLPPGVSGVLTASKPVKFYLQHDEVEIEKITSLSREDACEIIWKSCESNHKLIHDSVLNTLLAVKRNDAEYAYTSPLWLHLVLHILLNLDKEDFDCIRKRKEDDKEEQIERYLCELIYHLPAEVEELFLFLMDKAASSFGIGLVTKVLGYISVSRNGLREKDLSILLQDEWSELDFSLLRRWLRPFFSEGTATGVWDINHYAIKTSIRSRLCDELPNMHSDIATLLLSYPNYDPLRITESLYHLWQANNSKDVGRFILSSPYNSALLAIKQTLYDCMGEDKMRFEQWLVESAGFLSVDDLCTYFALVIKFCLSTLPMKNYSTYIGLVLPLLKQIDIDTVKSTNNVRAVGATCQDISLWCKQNLDKAALLKVTQMSVCCYQRLLCGEPDNELFKNALAIGYYGLGESYSECGDYDKALEYYSKMSAI